MIATRLNEKLDLAKELGVTEYVKTADAQKEVELLTQMRFEVTTEAANLGITDFRIYYAVDDPDPIIVGFSEKGNMVKIFHGDDKILYQEAQHVG